MLAALNWMQMAIRRAIVLALSLAWLAGIVYWLWVAYQVGSFWMFVIGLVPAAFPVTGTVGAYSLAFGVPGWVFRLFG